MARPTPQPMSATRIPVSNRSGRPGTSGTILSNSAERTVCSLSSHHLVEAMVIESQIVECMRSGGGLPL